MDSDQLLPSTDLLSSVVIWQHKEAGTFEKTLSDLYEFGRRTGWKLGGSTVTPVQSTAGGSSGGQTTMPMVRRM